MRTLAIQVRLRRLLRVEAEVAGRLAAEPENRDLAAAAVGRLLDICAGIREGWAQESAAGPAGDELAALRHAVARSLSTIEAAIAEMQLAGADIGRLSAEVRNT